MAKKNNIITIGGKNDTISSYLRTQIDDPLYKGIISTINSSNNFGLLRDYNSINFENEIKLGNEINSLKGKLNDVLKELESERVQNKENKEKEEELRNIINELNSKEKISHIIPRINIDARDKLINNDEFKSNFENGKSYNTIVLSIDIRRSTELMLKARTPELFSNFITELTEKLSQVILSNYGIFDKFTGDGILAFFPKFYSGEKAILRAIKAAHDCHQIFTEHYFSSRECFNVFIKDTGLGIGLDYGLATLVNTRNELTVVGIPVVYACRMSGAKAGTTLLNQPAIEELQKQYNNSTIQILETEIEIKNEGIALAYLVTLNSEIIIEEELDWK